MRIGWRQKLAEHIIRFGLKIWDVQYRTAYDWEIELRARKAADWAREHLVFRKERWENVDNVNTRWLDVPVDFDTNYPNLDELTDEQYKLFMGKNRGE